MNSVQFNALAIVLVLAILPFGVAIVSSLGSSTNSYWDDSMKQTDRLGEPNNGSYIFNNGGKNFTEHYDDLYGSGHPYPQNAGFIDCSYVKDGICSGGTSNVYSNTTPPLQDVYRGSNAFPMITTLMYQSHYYPTAYSGPNQTYVGESGSKEFSWILSSQLFQELKQDTSLDALRITMIDGGYGSTVYYNDSSAVDIGFNLCIEFQYNGKELEYCGTYESDNFICYQLTTTVPLCYIGLDVNMDFTAFETLEIAEFNGGNWTGTKIKISFVEFYRMDELDFGGTPIPMAGNQEFSMGIQHKTVNSKEVGFLIKTGTIALSIGIILLGIASTPFWDPLKQSFKGSQ